MKHLLIILMFLIACEEETAQPCTPVPGIPVHQIYVDSECNSVTNEAIVSAVDKTNEFTNRLICQDTVEVVGTIDVQNKYNLKPGTDVDIFVCYNKKPEWFDNSKYEKWFGSCSRYKEFMVIRLFLFWTPEFLYESLIMHEMGHYIGMGHTPDKKAIMYKDILKKKNYNKSDRNMFKKVVGI